MSGVIPTVLENAIFKELQQYNKREQVQDRRTDFNNYMLVNHFGVQAQWTFADIPHTGVSLSPFFTEWEADLQGQVFGSLLALHIPDCVAKLNAYGTTVGSPTVVTAETFREKRMNELVLWEAMGKMDMPKELDWTDEVSRAFFRGTKKGLEDWKK